MLKLPVLALALVFLLHHNAVSCDNVGDKTTREEEYIQCLTGKIFNGQLLHSIAARSSLDCLSECTQTEGCMGVNVCPAGQGGLVDCGLLSQVNPAQCGDLQDASHSSCFFAQKVKDTVMYTD